MNQKYNELFAKLPVEKLSNKKMLITGANGLIASVLVEELLKFTKENKLNTHVYALCRNKERGEKRFDSYLSDEYFHLIIQDVIYPIKDDIDFDYIIHAASDANPKAFNTRPVDVMKANFIGTLNLLEYSRKCTNCRFMYVSSSEVYGENFEEIPVFTEDMPGTIDFTRFRACYPESKRASETLCFSYEKQFESDIVIVRPAFIYGKEVIDSNNRADAYFMKQALNNEDIVMYSEGSQLRSYCYVKDCALGMIYALLLGEKGTVYNISNNDCVVSLKEYAQLLADVSGVKLIFDPSSKPENTALLKTTKLVLSTDRLEGLGWKPTYSLYDGLNEVFSRGD